MIKDILEDLKGYNRLTNHVLDYYIDESVDYDSADDLLRSMEDLQQYGCVSGMIGELIYYDDTEKFFDEYKEEINEMIYYLMLLMELVVLWKNYLGISLIRKIHL